MSVMITTVTAAASLHFAGKGPTKCLTRDESCNQQVYQAAIADGETLPTAAASAIVLN